MTTRGTIKTTLRRKGGGVLAELDLPSSLRQVPLNRFIDFLVECRAMDDEDQNQLVLMARAISGFCDYPLIEIIEAEIGDVYAPNLVNLDGSIRGIFGYIAGLVERAEGEILNPDTAGFTFKGDQYKIPVILQQQLVGEFELPSMAVIDVIEAAEIQRFKLNKTKQVGDPDGRIRQQIMTVANHEMAQLPEKDPARLIIAQSAEKVIALETERAGDPSGSLLYSMYLKMLAVIARREDEQMPFDDGERETWINDRAHHFKGIDAQTALNADFFLTSILPISNVVHPVIGFLSRQSFAVVAAIRLRNKKRTTGRRITTTRFFAESVTGG